MGGATGPQNPPLHPSYVNSREIHMGMKEGMEGTRKASPTSAPPPCDTAPARVGVGGSQRSGLSCDTYQL